MNYETVRLKAKRIAGISERTNNMDPEMGKIIGGLWQRFFQEGIYAQIEKKMNQKTLGIYSDYEDGAQGFYDVTVGCEVEKDAAILQGAIERYIPEGTFARFVIKGDPQKAVAEFWEKLWGMDLKRTFLYDFEEYQDCEAGESEIHIYIGIEG